MPKPAKFVYSKKEPFRDASYFIVVCEGENREPGYFRFFEGLSSRVKIYPVSSDERGSAPGKLVALARDILEKLDFNHATDQVWFVVDTDRWKLQIRELRIVCEHEKQWFVAQSNPCFEVWLYYHISDIAPDPALDACKKWKPHIPMLLNGGFDCDRHPIWIKTAIENARRHYKGEGDTPALGSTQLWQLAEALLPLIEKDLERIRIKFA